MTEQSAESKISDIIKTIRTWSLLWDLNELLKEIIKNSTILLNADFGHLLILEETGLTLKAAWVNTELKPIKFLPEIAEKVIRHGVAVYAHDLMQGEHSEAQVYCVPMTANRGVLGVLYLELLNRKEEISADEKLLLEMLGLQAASFLENSILYHSAITDPLTGLYSHRHFQQECDQIMRRAERTQSSVTLMILDLDHFKQLNDKHGHQEGNICLKRISEILKNNFRMTDIIARFGGDEFEILLPDASVEKSLKIAQTLNELIRNEKFPLQITGTIGIATYPLHASDSQSLFLAADQALYIGKEQGRNCVVVSTLDAKNTKNLIPKAELKSNILSKNPSSIQPAIPGNIKKDIQRIDGLDIVSRIASSSNGEVLLAKQHELDRYVALKRPLTSHLTEEQSAAFKKEALITASLSHPGIVPLYTMGQGVDGRLYYTMKPLDGISLEDLLAKWKKKDSQIIKEYNLFKLVNILLKASETVAYAHSQEIAHLDIHPANIIVGEFGEITLIDWGKGAKLNEKKIETNNAGVYISGSPIYRAPEQLKSGQYGKYTDVYSLGIILFEILTDKTPFKKDSTRDTIDAIIVGIDQTSQSDEVYQGSDPLLATACKNAIIKDPLKRISSAEFAKLLSRYVMLEVDINTHIFHTAKNPLRLEDWKKIQINSLDDMDWQINDGVLSSNTPDQQHILYWRTPITGNFSFTCEGWVTKEPRELGLTCFGKSIKDTTGWNNRNEIYNGYYFEFGADNNFLTKLSRHGDDILVDSKHRVELNKKYIMTVSYQDGWLHCYIDKMLIFTYRELHPFKGFHIGLYTYSDGSHFRPIDVKYQSTGLMIPAIRLADEHLAYNSFDIAINRYDEIIQTYPDRLEGFEALLKKGFCYAKLGNPAKAIEIFDSLKDTILEPYALAERAMMELPNNTEYEAYRKDGDYKQAYLSFKTLAEKFPGHQALFRILHPCYLLRAPHQSNHIFFKKNLEETLLSKIELFKIGFETITPPSQSQIKCLGAMISHLIIIGSWDRAMKYLKENMINHLTYVKSSSLSMIDILHICYCCNKTEEFESEFQSNLNTILLSDLYPIIIIDKINIQYAFDYFAKQRASTSWKSINYKVIFQLGLKQKPNFTEFVNQHLVGPKARSQLMFAMREIEYLLLEMMIASDYEDECFKEIKNFIHILKDGSAEHAEEATHLESYIMAIKNIFDLDLAKGFENISQSKDYHFKIYPVHEKKLLLYCFFSALGFKINISKEELLNENGIYLAGPRLELANNFLKGEDFTLSDKWSIKPSYCYFDRVLYCFWLLEKKHYLVLKETFKTLINPKLGNAYFQPLLIRLEEELKQRLKGQK